MVVGARDHTHSRTSHIQTSWDCDLVRMLAASNISDFSTTCSILCHISVEVDVFVLTRGIASLLSVLNPSVLFSSCYF